MKRDSYVDSGHTCPVCASVETHGTQALYDDRYGFPGTFYYRCCRRCGHVFCENPPCDDDLVELYTRYYPRAQVEPSSHRPHSEPSGFRAWLNGTRRAAYCYVPCGVRVLDIGCGTCESLGYHVLRGCLAAGVESDGNVAKIASAYGYDVKIGLFSPEAYDRDFFDYVTLDQVFEHMADPYESLTRISAVLRPGGTVVISTPNVDGWGAKLFGSRWINWHPPYHVNLFTPQSLSQLASRAGFILKDIRTLTSSDWLHFQWCHLITYPPEAEASAYWAKIPPKKLSVRLMLKGISLAHHMKCNHVVTRIFDLIGKGDNIVALLEKQ